MDLVHAWVTGWAVSREAAAPVAQPYGFSIEVGQPGHVRRHVLPAADPDALERIVAATTTPGTWLKVFAPAEEVAPFLTPGWEIREPGFLMTRPLEEVTAVCPEGYEVVTETAGTLTRVRIVVAGTGEEAARGRIVAGAGSAVVDRVATEEPHRRRGLGSVVMRTLEGLGAGRTGVLAATRDGRALYGTLGWRLVAPLTSVVFG
ncbi:GNAT family N-acetyltransferase [Thermoactinospora rubra]|uniref:GNAT family N-acetyltransferase n=1 Tax=Thermoactinospora rubra TaxID=1088767 RepID=UPI000A1091B7|nr:hypothetical protein [Thermoactinospora rubra]